MLLLDYQNVLIESLLNDRFSGYAQTAVAAPSPPEHPRAVMPGPLEY